MRNSETGEPWRDNIGGAWLDPSAPGVAEYLASIAGDLAAKGFDEVQLDYIRFFSDGPFAAADTNLPNTQSFRLPAIGRVLRVVSEELDTTRAFLGADVFPISFIAPDDQGIGQRPEVIMPFVDYFCPMVYPSHYGPGVFGFPVPNEFPYEVIDETLQIMNEQKEGLPVVIRPWIQDFGYGPFPPYTAAQVEAEFAAAADNGARGWMIWNARATFTESALGAAARGRGLRTDDVRAAGGIGERRAVVRAVRVPLMRLVVQRVTRASVRSGDEPLGEIEARRGDPGRHRHRRHARDRRPHGRQAHRAALLRGRRGPHEPRHRRRWWLLPGRQPVHALRRRSARPAARLHARGSAGRGRTARRSLRGAASRARACAWRPGASAPTWRSSS